MTNTEEVALKSLAISKDSGFTSGIFYAGLINIITVHGLDYKMDDSLKAALYRLISKGYVTYNEEGGYLLTFEGREKVEKDFGNSVDIYRAIRKIKSE